MRKNSLDYLSSGFGHDAEVVSVRMEHGSIQLELRGSVIRAIKVPDVIALFLTELTVQNVIFSIRKVGSLDEVKKLFSDIRPESLYTAASQHSLIKRIEDGDASMLHIDSTVGLNGFIVTSASLADIELLKSDSYTE